MAVAPSIMPAQGKKEPRRPKLAAGADTNDARAYYDFAMQQLTKEPGDAANALYWATRLDPMFAEAYYTRRIALMLEDPRRLQRYWNGDRRAVEEMRPIDSLMYQALTINPFLPRRLDKKLFDALIDDAIAHSNGSIPDTELRYEIDKITAQWPPASRAWLMYGDGYNQEALALYGQAINRDKKNVSLRIDRARVYFNINKPDSAVADLTVALDEVRKAEKKDLIFIYQSQAFIEHSLAVAYQALGKNDAAKEAFGRALQEDLSYYPAHLQLSFMALEAKDTTTSLAELDLATQLRSDDPGAQYLHGYSLLVAGKAEAAQSHIKRAIELDPVYAAPKYLSALMYESYGFDDDAIAGFKEYLKAAARSDPHRPTAEAHLAKLTKTPPGGVR
jgi:tetratricopeptide (TPR) repeat protein